MTPLAPFRDDVSSSIANDSQWHQSIGANGDSLVPLASLTPMVSMVPLTTLAIPWYKWQCIGIIYAIGVNDANGANYSSDVIDFNVQLRV